MKPLIKRLNYLFEDINKYKKSDFKILACCCGHSRYPMTIIISSIDKETTDKEKVYHELISGKQIYRKRKFYKRDKKGYYFIPEVENEQKKLDKK